MQQAVASRPRVFYGWWIVAGGALGNAISSGFSFHGLNAFILPLSDSFGVSLTAVAAGLSIARIESAFIGPLEGYLIDRFGPRKMMLIGVPLMGTGYILVSFTPSFATFIPPFLLGIVLGSALGFHGPLSTAVANWWQRKRGRAFGFMWLGHSLGAMSVPLINLLILNFGWRGAFRIMGLLVFVLGLPVASLMRHRPEQYGMRPDGDDPTPREGSAPILASSTSGVSRQATSGDEERDFTIFEAMRTPAFWYFALSVSARTGITTAVAINSFALVEALGGDSAQASLLFLIQGIFSAPGRLFLSWAGDTINKRYIMAACLLVMATTLFLMSQATAVSQLALLWVPYSIVWGGLSSLPQALRADLFGRRNFATIQGTMSLTQNAFSVTMPIFAAWVFERAGTYEIPFLTFGIVALVSGLLILQAKPPRIRAAAQNATKRA